MINYLIWSIAGWHATPGARIAKKKPKAKLHIWLRSRGDLVFFRLCAGFDLLRAEGYISTLPMMAHVVPGIELQICENCRALIKQEGHEIDDYFEARNMPGLAREVEWLIEAGTDAVPFAELPFALSMAIDENLEQPGLSLELEHLNDRHQNP